MIIQFFLPHNTTWLSGIEPKLIAWQQTFLFTELSHLAGHGSRLEGRLNTCGLLIIHPANPVFTNMRLFTLFMPTLLSTDFPMGILNIHRILRCSAALSVRHNPEGSFLGLVAALWVDVSAPLGTVKCSDMVSPSSIPPKYWLLVLERGHIVHLEAGCGWQLTGGRRESAIPLSSNPRKRTELRWALNLRSRDPEVRLEDLRNEAL